MIRSDKNTLTDLMHFNSSCCAYLNVKATYSNKTYFHIQSNNSKKSYIFFSEATYRKIFQINIQKMAA